MQSKDIVFGIHSIIEAIRNPKRINMTLYGTKEAIQSMSQDAGSIHTHILTAHELNLCAQKLARKNGFDVDRVPGGLFLEAEPLALQTPHWLYETALRRDGMRIVALDQVTDVHNGAAMMRTAAFYNVDAFCFSQKGNFGLSPSFFRIASGATEHVDVVVCPNLSRSLRKLSEIGVKVVGLAEESERKIENRSHGLKTCLVLGSEERGLSNAVRRSIDENLAIPSQGCIRSLNVSAAAAVAFQIFWGDS